MNMDLPWVPFQGDLIFRARPPVCSGHSINSGQMLNQRGPNILLPGVKVVYTWVQPRLSLDTSVNKGVTTNKATSGKGNSLTSVAQNRPLSSS